MCTANLSILLYNVVEEGKIRNCLEVEVYMSDFESRLADELTRQKRLLKFYRHELNKLSHFSNLRLQTHRYKDTFYYEIVLKRDPAKKAQYIGAGENSTVENIKKRRFIEESIKQLTVNVKCLEIVVANFASIDVDSIEAKLPASYRFLPEDCYRISGNERAVADFKEKIVYSRENLFEDSRKGGNAQDVDDYKKVTLGGIQGKAMGPGNNPIIIDNASRKFGNDSKQHVNSSSVNVFVSGGDGSAVHPESLMNVTRRGEKVRSRVELIIANELYFRDIKYVYERKINVGGKSFLPDFIVESPRTGQAVIWEHFGMMDDDNYFKKYADKMKKYLTAGLTPNIDLITTFDTSQHGVDAYAISKTIDAILLE